MGQVLVIGGLPLDCEMTDTHRAINVGGRLPPVVYLGRTAARHARPPAPSAAPGRPPALRRQYRPEDPPGGRPQDEGVPPAGAGAPSGDQPPAQRRGPPALAGDRRRLLRIPAP